MGGRELNLARNRDN